MVLPINHRKDTQESRQACNWIEFEYLFTHCRPNVAKPHPAPDIQQPCQDDARRARILRTKTLRNLKPHGFRAKFHFADGMGGERDGTLAKFLGDNLYFTRAFGMTTDFPAIVFYDD